MDIPEIANLQTQMQMRREVLKLAIEKNFSEERIWDEVDIYRKSDEFKRRNSKPVHIKGILLTILDRHVNHNITDSPIEDILKQALYNKGIIFETQKEVGPYKADFFFPEAKLVIEADGRSYHTSPDQMKYDEKRDSYLRRRGYLVIRFTGRQIYTDPERCINVIMGFLSQDSGE